MPTDPALNDGAATPLPSARQLAWLLVQPPTELAPTDAAVVARVEQDPSSTLVSILSFQFNQVDAGKLSLALLLRDSDGWCHRNETCFTAV
jgi:hypothetical protein